MGAGSSKSEDASKHVFSSGAPVQFSQELVDSLQASTESNSTRAKTLELHIAERVAAELEKLQKREAENLDSIRSSLSAPDTPSSSPSESSSSTTSKLKSAASSALLHPTQDKSDAQSSQKVQGEIAKLKQQLAERKVLKDLPPGVEKARSAVVSCLRVNDRRPLDCWKEVEGFKLEVRKMEEKFVGDIL